MGTLARNGLDEGKKVSTNEVEKFCIKKAKLSMSNGDSNLAKSWFLAASNLFPDSFSIKFEQYLQAKDEGRLMEACRHLNDIFSSSGQSISDNINQEMQRIVTAVKGTINNPDSTFYRNLFNCFSLEAQHKLLLNVANLCSDPMESCQLMLLIMKKFPNKINEHASNILQLIKRAEENQGSYRNSDYFNKLLVFDILPVILSPESNLDTSLSLMLSLLDRTIEFYCQSSIIGMLVDEETSTDVNIMDKDRENRFDDVFNMFRKRLKWDLLTCEEHSTNDNFLSGILLAHFQRIQKFFQDVSTVSMTPESDGPIDLSSSNTKVEIKAEHINQVLYATFLLFIRCLHKYTKETAGKLILVEQGASYKGDPVKKRKIHLKSSSPIIFTENSELQENFTVALQALEFLNQDYNLTKEMMIKFQQTKVFESRAYQMLKQDCLIYRGNHDDCLASHEATSKIKIKSCLQSISSALMSYNYGLALKHSLDGVAMLTRVPEMKEEDDKPKMESNHNGGRQIVFINYNRNDILTYCIEVIIACLKDRVLLSVKPSDHGLGHLIVLSQYNWPKEVDLFLKCISTIRKPITGSPTAPVKFVYLPFCDFIFNPDMLEEFMSLVNSKGITLEIKDQVTPQINKFAKSSKTITRGVNKNAKEEIKTILVNQMKRSKLILEPSLFINFILNHIKDLS
ncbi:integrator complex subunit 10-like [Panonychus citri]|uniref:integrator complex subunit 10-like n=1 Tax=Panonychus citri TaxID=50023 RepID=UPI0023081C2D|nr:integrator complex subunit 10-like [Panonychus citri]